MTTLDEIWRSGLAPDPQITITQWSDLHRTLPATSAEPGRWSTARTPYLAGPMDVLSATSPIERVVIMKAAQVGGTEVGLNFVASIIALTPGLCLYVMPTHESARRTVRSRVDPMIEAIPELRSRVVTPGPRKAGNSAFFKSFPGGALAFVGANSGVGLRSTPARFLILDEIDGFPSDAGGEGDPVALAIARTATFKGRRKVLLISTPTTAGVSRIESAYAETDQRRFEIACPLCVARQTLKWSGVHWPDGDPARAYYACEACGGIIEERDKPRLLAGGRWQPTATGDGRSAGFHIGGLLSPFVGWGELARDHLAAKVATERLMVWTNTGLGEAFEDRETAPLAPDTLQGRAEDADPAWIELLPDGVAVVVAAVDVQDDRLEVEFVGFGRAEESWSVDYAIIAGDTTTPGPWDALDRLIARRFRHPRAVADLPVSAVAVDSGGHRTDQVMRYSATRLNRRVWAIKGRGGAGVPPWPRRPPKPRKASTTPVHIVGVDALKLTLFTRLRSTEASGPGVCHFPSDRDYYWFAGLVAERAVRKWTRGVPRLEFIVDKGVRNEPLDCRVYCMAALHGLYAAGFSLTEAAARITDAPMRTTADAPPPPTRPSVIRSKWLER